MTASRTESGDLQKMHQHFAADCFNRAWELIDKPGRSPQEVQEMIHRAHASRWHWEQFDQHKPRNLAVGDWQLSRVYALAQRPIEAQRYAESCLDLCERHDLGAFDLAFAHEALARAAGTVGAIELRDTHLGLAYAASRSVTGDDDRNWLLSNLDPISRGDYGWPATATGRN